MRRHGICSSWTTESCTSIMTIRARLSTRPASAHRLPISRITKTQEVAIGVWAPSEIASVTLHIFPGTIRQSDCVSSEHVVHERCHRIHRQTSLVHHANIHHIRTVRLTSGLPPNEQVICNRIVANIRWFCIRRFEGFVIKDLADVLVQHLPGTDTIVLDEHEVITLIKYRDIMLSAKHVVVTDLDSTESRTLSNLWSKSNASSASRDAIIANIDQYRLETSKLEHLDLSGMSYPFQETTLASLNPLCCGTRRFKPVNSMCDYHMRVYLSRSVRRCSRRQSFIESWQRKMRSKSCPYSRRGNLEKMTGSSFANAQNITFSLSTEIIQHL